MLIILTGPHKVKKFHVLWDSMRPLDWECSTRRKLWWRSSRLLLDSLDLNSSSTRDRTLQLGQKIVCKCIYILYLQLFKALFITGLFYD